MFLGLGVGAGVAPMDLTAPSRVGAPVIGSSGLTLTITYNETLDSGSVPTLGLSGTVSTVSSVAIVGSTVVATLNTAAIQGETITVSSSGTPIRDSAGNAAAALGAVAVTNNSTVATELIQISTVAAADGFGDMLTNVSALKESSPVSDIANNVQYVPYHAQDKKLKIAKRTLPSGTWTVDTSGRTGLSEDAHNFYSLAVDGSGRLHVAGDMHAVPMKYWRASAAGDYHIGSSWFTVPTTPGSTLESSVTYPFFIRLPNGDLLRFFRAGGAGDGDLIMERWRDASNGGDDAWHTVFANLIDGQGARSAYPHRIVFDPTSGKLGIAWCWRDSTGINTNHDWAYMCALYSEDFATWRKADGSTQTIPATLANAGYAATIAVDCGLDNSQGFAFDDSGRPIICGYYDIAKVNGIGGQGISQFVLRFWDGSAWQARMVPGDVRNQEVAAYSLANATGTPTVPLSVPLLLRSGARTFVIFRSTSRGDGIWAWVCEESTLTNWALVRLTSDAVGDWYPSVDEAYFRATGDVMMYVQRTTRDSTAPIGATDVKVLRWRPASSYPYTAPAAYFDPESVAGCLFAWSARANTANVIGTPGANMGRTIDLLDLRAGSSRKFTQATSNNRPIWTAPGGIAAANPKFTKSLTHSITLTDATVSAALNGSNAPFTAFITWRATTNTLNDMIWAMGSTSSTAQYFHVAIGTGGTSLSVARRTGGGQVTIETVTGLITAGVKYVITLRFDGTNVRIWINGVEAAWSVTGNALATAGSLAVDNVTLLCRQRTTRDNPGDGESADYWLYTGSLSTGNIATIENALGAERTITITH